MNPVQILQGMAQQAAQAAQKAFQNIPATLKAYSSSGQMDADLRNFGQRAAEETYKGMQLFFEDRAAALATNLVSANLQVAATMGILENSTVGVARGFDMATGSQRALLDNSRRIFATVTSTLGAQMTQLTDTSGRYVASSVRRTLDQVEKSNKEAAGRTVETVGNIGLSLYEILPNFAETLQSTNQAILLDSQTYYRAGIDMTEKALVNNAALARGFGFTSAEINAFTLRDIEKTGKATGETVMEVVASAFAAADALGAAPRITNEQIKVMTNNVERYGSSTTSQLGAVSVQLQQLSLDVGSLDKLVGTFSGFDSAISKSNDLAALFGVQLDSMEAMYLAAEDPTKLLETIREQLIDQGVDVSNMGQSQLRALSRTLGMTVEETKRYLQGDLVTSYEEAYTAIEDGTRKALTDQEALAARSAKIGADGSAMSAEAIEKAQRDKMAAATVVKSYAEVVAQSNQAISAALGEANNQQRALYETTLKTTEEALRAFNTRMPELITEFVLPFFKASIDKITSTFEGAQKGTPPVPPLPSTSPASSAPAPAAPPAPVTVPGAAPAPVAPPVPTPPAPAATALATTPAPAAASPVVVPTVKGTILVKLDVNTSTGAVVAAVEPSDTGDVTFVVATA